MLRLALEFALIGVVAGMLAGSADVARAEPELSKLARTFWKLDHIDALPTEANVIVQISKNEIAFSGPCRAGRYPFAYDKSGVVRFHPAWSTTEATGDARCAAEPKWGTIELLLAKVKRHALNADGLTLLDESGRPVMALSRIGPAGIENREWAIAEYWNGDSLVSAEETANIVSVPEIVFVHGRIRGTPGCGGLLGDYRLSEQRLKLHATVILAGSCPRLAMVQMERLTEALNGDWSVEHEPQRTLLRDAEGAIRIVLRPY
jgi:heat shock protein HslJ